MKCPSCCVEMSDYTTRTQFQIINYYYLCENPQCISYGIKRFHERVRDIRKHKGIISLVDYNKRFLGDFIEVIFSDKQSFILSDSFEITYKEIKPFENKMVLLTIEKRQGTCYTGRVS